MPAEITDIRHLRTLARLRRVDRQLALRDEVDAMALPPPSLWPLVEVPVLDREALKELRAELLAALCCAMPRGGDEPARRLRRAVGPPGSWPVTRDSTAGRVYQPPASGHSGTDGTRSRTGSSGTRRDRSAASRADASRGAARTTGTPEVAPRGHDARAIRP